MKSVLQAWDMTLPTLVTADDQRRPGGGHTDGTRLAPDRFEDPVALQLGNPLLAHGRGCDGKRQSGEDGPLTLEARQVTRVEPSLPVSTLSATCRPSDTCSAS